MTGEFITLGLVFASIWPIAHYTVRYSGWKYPEYHQNDLQKLYASMALSIALLIFLIIEMAHS